MDREQTSIAIPWVSLSLLLAGMLLNFCSVFGCTITWRWHLPICVLTAGLVLFLSVKRKGGSALLGVGIVLAGVLAAAAFHAGKLTEDFMVLAYYVNKRSMAYNQTQLIPVEGTPGNLDSNVLLRLLGMGAALFISVFAFRFHKRSYGFLPVYAVLALGLLVGGAPDRRSTVCLAVGAALGFAWLSVRERGGKKNFTQRKVTGRKRGMLPYVLLSGILLFGVLGAGWYGGRQEKKILSHAGDYLKKQHQMERQLAVTAALPGKSGVGSDAFLPPAGDILSARVYRRRLSKRTVEALRGRAV